MSHLSLRCPSAAALSALLQQAGATATLLVPEVPGVTPPPFAATALHIDLPTSRLETDCEVLQVLPGAGIVVRLLDPALALHFAQSASDASAASAASAAASLDQAAATSDDSAEECPPEEAADYISRPRRISSEVQAAGTTPLSWPIERLRADWHSLSQPDRIRIARYGKRPARSLVLKSNDKKLMVFLLQNTRITADEVAVMAAMATLDPDLLRRIATSSEWTRHTAVARNLVCNPKVPGTLIKKLVDALPLDELRRLARGGRVRASTKQLIMRRVDRGK